MHDRIGIFIDLEGAKYLYKKDNSRYYFEAIDTLLETTTIICEQFLPEEHNRLFAHQVGGDGVLIISESIFKDKNIPVAISIAIMQTLLLFNFVCKAGIAKGEFSDIQSCLPKFQQILRSKSGRTDCGGLMTKFDVMGTALINSYRLINYDIRGSLLLMESDLLTSKSEINFTRYNDESSLVDWIHSETKFMDELFGIIGMPTPKINDLQNKLLDYTNTYNDELWVKNTLKFNGL